MTRKQKITQGVLIALIIWPWIAAFADMLAYGATGHWATSIDWLSGRGVFWLVCWPVLAGFFAGVWE